MNIYLFNYRGVSHSQGELVQAWDLVEDGRVCIEYMTSSSLFRGCFLFFPPEFR